MPYQKDVIMIRLFCVVLASLILLLFFGCTSLKPFRVIPDTPPNSIGKLPAQPDPNFDPTDSTVCSGVNCIRIVEYDEFGNAFSRAQLDAGVAAARAISEEGGSVIVYVHGWHHSAKPGDDDINNFLSTVADSAERTKRKTLGIYVGWRGDSIDSDNVLLKLPSYALTFWDRKATAHAVGHGGGVSELIRKLSAIRADNKKSQFMILGHSFGGAIVYSAVSQLVAEQISLDSESGGDQLTSEYEFRPIADLVVLLNPAFEAMRMTPLYALARSYEYRDGLAPRLVVITSTADWATKITFPLGRTFGTLFKGYPDKESGKRNRTAIGHYTPFITHQLVAGKCDRSLVKSNENILTKLTWSEASTKKLCFKGENNKYALVLTRCDAPSDCKEVTDGHSITRGAAEDGYIPKRFPILNIRTNDTMIEDHSAIWGANIKLFLLGLLDTAINDPGSVPTAPL